MKTHTDTNPTIVSNDLNFNDLVKRIGLELNHHANNEEILDKLLLHGKYVDQFTEDSSADLNSYLAELEKFTPDKILGISAILLQKNYISKEYYETQTGRYGASQTGGRYSIFNSLRDDQTDSPKKDLIKEQDIAPTNTRINLLRP